MSTSAVPHPGAASRSGSAASRARSLVRGRTDDPVWVRPALIALLAATAIAYLVDLQASGYANEFYAAAAQAATKSWKAFFFGSLDSSSFITVDKPPASLWVMALSGRVFGFSSFSMLAPQALEGVVSVGLLYAAVRRWFGPRAGLLAGLALATTPVAALMFRFNNPDALLVCLLVASAYCLVRAVEDASTRWVLATGALVGFAFLAKMGQALLVVPAFGLVYLVAAPTRLRRRMWQSLAGAGAIVVSAGWWVAIVALWPAGSRPMIDGSPTNSILNLITGYNGLSRIFGGGGPAGGGPGPGGGGAGGLPGLPSPGLGGGALGLPGPGGAGPGPGFGGPGAGGGQSFSGPTGVLRLFNDLMGGQASWLLPAALLMLGGGLWLTRSRPRTDRTRAALLLWGGWLVVSALVFSLSSGVIHTYYTVALAPPIAAVVAIGVAALWRHRDRQSARVALAGGVAATGAWAWILLDRTPDWEPWLRSLVIAVTVLAVAALLLNTERLKGATLALMAVACLAGPVAYSLQTITTAQTSPVVAAGPSTSTSPPFGGGGPPRGSGSSSAALVKLLEQSNGHYRWVAATSGSQAAASLELASGGAPVMAIGGFNNQGGNISLAQFQQYVRSGAVHYYVVGDRGPGGLGGPGGPGGGPGGPGGGGTSQSITAWVEGHFKATAVGGQTVYVLSA